MSSIPLNVQDATFLHVETARLPTHIAGLQVFRAPADSAGFVPQLVESLLSVPASAFFRRRLKQGAFGIGLTPAWVVDDAIDLDYHVRRIALPQPGSRAQLERLVERLHARMLDRARPLWECYFIEGLNGGEFAVYTKIHHAMADGVAGMMLALSALSADPGVPATAPWAIEPPATPVARPSLGERLRRGAGTVLGLQRMGISQSLAWMERSLGERPEADLPFAAPRVHFNGYVDGHRRYATRSLPMARVRRIAQATDTTLNDVVLALTGGALRTWLAERDDLPNRSLTASCPVSVRADAGTGNNLSALLCDLGTDLADPLARLDRVAASTRRGKRQVASLSPGAAEGWALAVGLAGLVPPLVNGGRTLPPLSNMVISNVPGPREARYLGGAELVGYYPVSVLTHGQGLNITLLSRGPAIDFGFLGAHSLVRDLGRLGDALEASLDDLEAAVTAQLDRRRHAAMAPSAGPVQATSEGAPTADRQGRAA